LWSYASRRGIPSRSLSSKLGRLACDFYLTTRQRRILQALAARQDVAFGELRSVAGPTVAVRTFRDDLLHLKRLGLIGLHGRGRAATWFMVRTPGGNRAE
jgi:hypothetical protein